MGYFNEIAAERLGGSAFGSQGEFKFEMIKRVRREVMEAGGTRLIDMGIGEPDSAADQGIISVLKEEAGKPDNRFYADNGIEEFQSAAAAYLKKIYGVHADPRTQILHGIGSKSILAMLPHCVINPGDMALVTVPGYPVPGDITAYLGGSVYPLPLLKKNAFLPDLGAVPESIWKKAKILYINYPNNPTGAAAPADFFQRVVAYADKYKVLVIHDAAYGDIVYDDTKPLSFLSVPGAFETGVEVHSLSKAFSMTGWRLAFLAGNADVVKAYGMVKDHMDSGQFRAIQKAGTYALEHPELTKLYRNKYSRRLDLLTDILKEAGFDAVKPNGTFYSYVKAPKGAGERRFESAGEAALYLLKYAGISVVPWEEDGGYLRFSVTFEAGAEEEAKLLAEAGERLKRLDLIF